MKVVPRKGHIRKKGNKQILVKPTVVKIHNMNPNMLRGMLNSPKTPKHVKDAWMAKLSDSEKTTLGLKVKSTSVK
jgi:hypothetical protein